MNDVAKWKVHGPVETLRKEFAIWDVHREEWQPARGFTVTSFRPDGKVRTSDTQNPDGSIAHRRWIYDDASRLTESNVWIDDRPIDRNVYSYDEVGRLVRTVRLSHDGTQADSEICSYDAGGKKTTVRFLGLLGSTTAYGIEGTELAYGAPGAAAMTTTYDEHDLPVKVVFENANHASLRHVIFTRDSEGRLIKEEMHIAGESAFPEGMVAFLGNISGEAFSSTTYEYDSQSRLLERTNRMASLGEDRTAYDYDDHDDPIGETTEHSSREASVDENGIVQYSAKRTTRQYSRMEYRYDVRGNWIERVVLGRVEPNAGFQRSNIERRIITYHALGR